MDELIPKHIDLVNALAKLKEALELLENPKYQEVYKSMRDSLIKRFEYSIDLFWKFLKEYMIQKLKMSIDFNAPRDILREAANVKILSDKELKFLLDAYF